MRQRADRAGVSHCKWIADGSRRHLAAMRCRERNWPVAVAVGCHALPAVAARCHEGSGSSSPPSDTNRRSIHLRPAMLGFEGHQAPVGSGARSHVPFLDGADRVGTARISSGLGSVDGARLRRFPGALRCTESNVMCAAGNASLHWSSTAHKCLIWAAWGEGVASGASRIWLR